jgi:cell division protein ZapA
MTHELETITVSLLGKKYQVSCGEDEIEALEKSAKYLNKKMQEIRDSKRVVGLDRIAVMAALNIVGESLDSTSGLAGSKIGNRIEALNETLEAALIKHTQLEI